MEAASSRGVSRVLGAIIVVVLVGASGLAYALYTFTNIPSQNVTFELDFTPNTQHAPYYYGIDQGFYKNQGINLTILPSKGTVAAVSAVSTGLVQFAIADTTGLILARATSNVSNVRIVSMVFDQNFYAAIYNNATVTKVSDLAGKSGAAGTAPNIQTSLFYLFAKDNGLNVSSMNIQFATPSTYAQLLVQGKIAFITNPVHNFPIISQLALKSGIKLGMFPFTKYGVNVYGQAIITTTQMIQDHSDLVRRFVAATLQSVVGAATHPEDAVGSLVKYQPQLNATTSLQGFKLDTSCCMANATGVTNPLTFGWIDPLRMQQTVSSASPVLGVKTPINASTLYTDDYTVHP